MARLASPIQEMKPHYQIVVVGSGYGGGIAASRMARAGLTVCVLERGKELRPGEYPDTMLHALSEMQMDWPGGRLGDRSGLYDLRLNPDLQVLVGCGLGGTSLINANVALRAHENVFGDPRWPRALREDLASLWEGYRRAEEMLKPTPYPADWDALPKLHALEQGAKAIHGRFARPPINVTFKDGVNHVGVEQHACHLCGDCVSGCNYGAKNTVLMNYLPDARNHGAEIYTEVTVRRVEEKDGRWLVHFELTDAGRAAFDAPPMFVRADIVILAAGALGSTEILLRSQNDGLTLSDQLGRSFNCNGDVLAFAYNNDVSINGVGFGPRRPGAAEPVGPCITGVIDLRGGNVHDDMVIEEGAIPGAFASRVLAAALAVAAGALGEDTDAGVEDYLGEKGREVESLLLGPYSGALRNTLTYLVMAHCHSVGRMTLEDDRLRIAWPEVGREPDLTRVNKLLEQTTRALGGTLIKNPFALVKNPLWSDMKPESLVSVHPLGGCAMADDAEHGVVNHKAQVFAAKSGTEVHPGLYVLDGSIVPTALNANPLLTISALAERACALLAKDLKRSIDYSFAPIPPALPEAPPRLGLQFSERMRGYLVTADGDSPFEFTVTIKSDDLDRMLRDPRHPASIVGTVTARALSPDPLTVSDGEFNLFVVDPDQVGARQMHYRMRLTSEEGRIYFLHGYKLIRDHPGFDVWSDTTTLYITVYDGPSARSPVRGRGILRVRFRDFLRQLFTFRVTNAASRRERWGVLARLRALMRFTGFFTAVLFRIYGGILAPAKVFDPTAPPRRKRPLRLPPPERDEFMTSDGVQIRLTRYGGGPKGPVILSPGFGTSALAFSIDTIETNLPEYLGARGYDVWLLDYRASPELPSAQTQFTIDDIVIKDYPAAVSRVRELTGAESVQFVGHCVGSMAILMSLAAGLQGVRSAVCSQVTVHVDAPFLNRIKAHLRLASFLEFVGRRKLTTYFDTRASLANRLFDALLRLLPTSRRCTNPVCRRILFMYGEVFKHDQLNNATHDAVHEMFGWANLTSFKQLSRMLRRHQAVDRDGQDVYLGPLERLAIPITFLHGEENPIFFPSGGERTFKVLCEKNGSHLYSRVVIPTYSHMDCFIGKNVARDVFPVILKALQDGDRFWESRRARGPAPARAAAGT